MSDGLLCGLDRLVCKFLVLEHCVYVSKNSLVRVNVRVGTGRLTESKFLKSAPECFRKHEVYECNLKRKPAAVRDEIPPAHVVESNWVDKGREKAGQATEKLENSNATGSFLVRPDLNHVR